VPGQSPQVSRIAGEDGPARLGNCRDQRVDRGPGASPGSQPGRPAGERNKKSFRDIAGAQEAVCRRVPGALTGVLLEQVACYLDIWPTMTTSQRSSIHGQISDGIDQAARLVAAIGYGRRQAMQPQHDAQSSGKHGDSLPLLLASPRAAAAAW
jgi:hypothetical protein